MALTVLLPGTPAGAAEEDGAALYKAHCASCHDQPLPRVPPFSALKALSREAVQASLSSGSMREQAGSLSPAQVAAVIDYIVPASAAPAVAQENRCKESAPPKAPRGSWNGWSTSPTGSRFQDATQAGLTAEQLPRLKLKWAFNAGPVTSMRALPVVVDGRVFVTTEAGSVHALDLGSGCAYWSYKPEGGVRGTVTVGEGRDRNTVYFGDIKANVYALDARTGKLLWKVHPTEHPATMITAAPRYHRGILYQGFSSYEELLGANPQYPCCTFRGSVVALDARSGQKLWQSFTIPEEPQPVAGGQGASKGPSGAGIWSTPTIDERLGVLYVATGDNYSAPATTTSDAILAMDLRKGTLLWSAQMTDSDTYNLGCDTPQKTHCANRGPDFDFGQPPILVQLGGGHRALVIAQKSGMAYGLDPDQKGAVLWKTRVGQGSPLGGSQWGSAADAEKVYVAVSDITITGATPDTKQPQGYHLNLSPAAGGGLQALELKTGKVVWDAKAAPCPPERSACSPAQSAAVTVIPGAVFSGSVDGHLRAYSTQTGKVLWDVDTAGEFPAVNGPPAHGGSIDGGGPVVVGGRVLVSSGYSQWGGTPGNAVLVFSIDGQ